MQERQLLQERIETLVGSIGNEVESRRGLRKEINEMNEAFKEEIMDMAREQKAANELEDCYFSDDEELVVNTHKRDDLGTVHILRKHLYYLVQLIEHPILRIPNFNFPNLRCCKVGFSF